MIAEHVPEYWGIISVGEQDGACFLTELRPASPSPKVKQTYKLRMLWRRELAELLRINGFPKYAQKSRKFVIDYLASKLSDDELKEQISDILFERDYTVFEDQPKRKRVRNRMSSVRVGKRAARKKKAK